MAYSTIQQVRDASGLQDDTNVTDAYITLKISYADGVINSAIGERYVLPLDSTPDIIAFLSVEIAVAVLFMDQYGQESEDSDKGWERRLRFLMAELEKIRVGKLKLIDATTGVEFNRSDAKLPSSYPTAASSDPDATDSTEPKIKMNQKW